MSKHVAIWMDHKEARVFALSAESVDEKTVLASAHDIQHKHPHQGKGAHDHPEEHQRFFHEVAEAVQHADEILVVGPGFAKLEFIRHLHKHSPLIEEKVVGVETVDHPTDNQIVAYAKKSFTWIDRMT